MEKAGEMGITETVCRVTALDVERIEKELGELKAYRVTLGEVLSPLWGKLDAIEAKG